MLEVAGLILGVLGVVFAFETPRKYVVAVFRGCGNSNAGQQQTFRSSPSLTAPMANSSAIFSGATQSGRYPFFITEPFNDLDAAIAESKKERRPLFLVIYDQAHPSQSQLYYSLGCFLDYFTTKKLVNDHFVTALVSSTSINAASFVPPDDPLENCLWVVLSPEGEILRREGVYANPDEGLKRVRAVIAQYAYA